MAALPRSSDPHLLVGADGADDAAVYKVSSELAIVSTVDFFTPIVDDPYDFGRIAATNALSDIYAMGARPVMALNLVAFSLESLGAEVLSEILRGGADVAARAGASVAGGHSIDDHEPKYGMAVTGLVDPSQLVTNAGARPGDELHLTKPVGGGLATTAAKRGISDGEPLRAAIEVMTTSNAEASIAALSAGATAMTDVTGFGLLGHLHELATASGCAAEIEAELVPAIEGTLGLAAEGSAVAGGSRRNAEHAASFTTWSDSVPEARRVLLTDAMTSGGLLVATPRGTSESPGTRIGQLREGQPGAIYVR